MKYHFLHRVNCQDTTIQMKSIYIDTSCHSIFHENKSLSETIRTDDRGGVIALSLLIHCKQNRPCQ